MRGCLLAVKIKKEVYAYCPVFSSWVQVGRLTSIRSPHASPEEYTLGVIVTLSAATYSDKLFVVEILVIHLLFGLNVNHYGQLLNKVWITGPLS